MIPLSRLPIEQNARVLSLSAEEPLKGRLMDLGFVPGSEIRPLYAAPMGYGAAGVLTPGDAAGALGPAPPGGPGGRSSAS